MQRIVYWDESYDEFFKERAGRNRSLAYQHLTQETH